MLDKFNLSYSSFSCYKQSPLQFYFQYLSGLAPSDKIDSKYADAGTAVHEALEQFLNVFKAKGHEEAIIESSKKFHEIWDKLKIPGPKAPYITMMDNGTQYILDHCGLGIAECKIEFYHPLGIKIKAYMDFVVDLDHYVKIYDWKTNTTHDVDKHKDQRRFYAWCIWNSYKKLSTCTWVYLRQDILYTDAFTEKDIMEFDKEIELFIQTIARKGLNINEYEPGDFKHPFNAYRSLCFNEIDRRLKGSTANITLKIKGNYIFIEGDVDVKLIDGIDHNTKFDLKQKYWMQKNAAQYRRGIVDLSDVGTVHLYNHHLRCFPIGLLDKVLGTIKEYESYYKTKININIVDCRDKVYYGAHQVEMPEKLLSEKKLRDYQDKAIKEFMIKKHGIINIATGGGKTFIAAEIIRQCKSKTLWIIDRLELLDQTKKELETMLGKDLGIIASGKIDIKDVTICTVQSLTTFTPQILEYLYKINMVVVDEYHKSAAESYQKIFAKLPNTEYRLGLTATVGRDDGKEPILFAQLGQIVYKISTDELIKLGFLIRPEIIFYELEDGVDTHDYVEDYNMNIVQHDERNNKIHQVCLENMDKKILIVTKLIEHGKKLNEMIDNSTYIHGSVEETKRKDMMDRFRICNQGVLIMTMSIAAEGLDIPDLDILINAGANKGDVKSVQVLGRVLRKIVGKEKAMYIDFHDKGTHTRKHSKFRMKALKEQGHNVEVI
jgi:superfamily II DNA or RNA helicase